MITQLNFSGEFWSRALCVFVKDGWRSFKCLFLVTLLCTKKIKNKNKNLNKLAIMQEMGPMSIFNIFHGNF